MPTALGVAEAQLAQLAEKHNLTAALADLRLLYASFQARHPTPHLSTSTCHANHRVLGPPSCVCSSSTASQAVTLSHVI